MLNDFHSNNTYGGTIWSLYVAKANSKVESLWYKRLEQIGLRLHGGEIREDSSVQFTMTYYSWRLISNLRLLDGKHGLKRRKTWH